VRGVAFRVLRDASEADYMLQDIFLLIHKDCRNFDPSKGGAQVLDTPDGVPSCYFSSPVSHLKAFLHLLDIAGVLERVDAVFVTVEAEGWKRKA